MYTIEALKARLVQPRNMKIRIHRPTKSGLERVVSSLNAEAALLRKVIVDGGSIEKHEAARLNFVEYYKGLCKGKVYSWTSAYHFLNRYTGGHLLFGKINKKWARDFVAWMMTHVREDKHVKVEGKPLVKNTAALYIHNISAAIQIARREDLYHEPNPFSEIDKPSIDTENNIDYLTEEEFKQLAGTPYPKYDIRRVFIFSVYTALRIGDLMALKWRNIVFTSEGCYLYYRQQKKDRNEGLKLPEHVIRLLGQPKDPDEPLFDLPRGKQTMKAQLRKWGAIAGITKHLHWHMSKHTIGTMLVDKNVPLYVIQKLLNHKTMRSTSVYAEVRDKKKEEALLTIPDVTSLIVEDDNDTRDRE
ncbi:MAG TPA: tyrosine-type recombinase/integrase [Candidatus Kapabacteria bacterium]|nr:tyrosine-type recombinase/integrase [Candidatus Kapabacteria bacterium]